MKKNTRKQKLFIFSILSLFLFMGIYLLSGSIFKYIGKILICDDPTVKSDVAVVLNTSLEYYPRLIEAASIYKDGLVKKIMINGNRKTDSLRTLELMNFKRCCIWYEDMVSILEILGVPRDDVIPVSVEDAYDTISEAEAVGTEIVEQGYERIILITSKFHTRRAAHIWKEIYKNKLVVTSVSAKTDPFNPESWWKHGRQIKWVMGEYGGWLLYYWKSIIDI